MKISVRLGYIKRKRIYKLNDFVVNLSIICCRLCNNIVVGLAVA